jgi:hypothetical protein
MGLQHLYKSGVLVAVMSLPGRKEGQCCQRLMEDTLVLQGKPWGRWMGKRLVRKEGWWPN